MWDIYNNRPCAKANDKIFIKAVSVNMKTINAYCEI